MSQERSMLVIDDEESICIAFKRFFAKRGWSVKTCGTGQAGLDAFEDKKWTVVFLDVRLPDIDGLEILNRMREQDSDARVIVISAYGSLETVTQAVQGKAFDYLAKPLDLDQAEVVAERAAAIPGPAAAPSDVASSSMIVGKSKQMQEVYKRIGLVAQSDSSVLILGETGTGKELVARAIHQHSPRSEHPFIAVNCGALPDNLVESELFGYEKGAFTGATDRRTGKFEAANEGTLFLDEVGELPAATQTKLLRVLDSQIIERLGSAKSIHLNVRILAATNRRLADDVAEGRFRADLYYRLNVIHIELPPLAERTEDILPLAQHFVQQLAPDCVLSEAAGDILGRHAWPGNVRELRNAIEHAVVVSGGRMIQPEHLPESAIGLHPCEGGKDAVLARYVESIDSELPDIYHRAIEPLERYLIKLALARCNGNQSEAAAVLGLHRNTLRNKLRELNM